MRSRSPLFLVALLLAGPLAPLAGGTHTDEGSWSNAEKDRRRVIFDPYTTFDPQGRPRSACAGGDFLNYVNTPVDASGPDHENATGIGVLYRDATSGLETWYYFLPDPVLRGDGTPITFPQNAADCEAIEKAAARTWRAPAGAPPFKVGDQFRLRLWYHAPGTTSGCPGVGNNPLTSRTGPAMAARINSTELGIATPLFFPVRDTDGRTNPRNLVTIVDAKNPNDASGWFTVPAPGGAVPAVDRTSPLGSDALPFTVDTYYTCPTPDNQAIQIQKAQRHTLMSRLDNVLPEVYVRVSHAVPAAVGANPAPPQEQAWTPSTPDLFTNVRNATVRQRVSVEVTICDPDFERDAYDVTIDFRGINATFWQNRSHKLAWSTQFVQAADRTGCGNATSSLPPRWVLNRTIEVSDATLDIGWNIANNRFIYRGIDVTVGDEVDSGWSGSKGNLRTVSVALNVDAVRPAGADVFTATPLPGGAVRLDWALPSGPAFFPKTVDLRAIEITARAVDDPSVVQSFLLVNGTTQVRSLFETNPCTVEIHRATPLTPSNRVHQWLERPATAPQDQATRGDFPVCLIIPDAVLPAAALPLLSGGKSRAYEFTLVTRDDAGNTPVTGASAAARLDALPPIVTPVSFLDLTARRLDRITVQVTDDSVDNLNRPDLASVTVTIANGSTVWRAGRWHSSGAADALPLSREADGSWSVAPGLTGSGGNLLLTVVAKDRAGNAATLTARVQHDVVAPSILEENLGVVPQGANFAAEVIGRLEPDGDDGTGVKRIDLKLHNASNVLWASATWCDGCGVPGAGPLAATGPWLLTYNTAALPLGVYSVTVEAQDGAGNSMQIRRLSNLTIVPRGATFRSEDTPYFSGTRLSALVHAGYDGARDALNVACPLEGSRRVCAPEVVLESLTTVGTWREVARRATPDRPTAPVGGLHAYSFEDVEVGNLGPAPRVRLKVVHPNATMVGPAVEPKTPSSEGVLFLSPINRWAPTRWWMTADAANANFQVQLTSAAEGAVGVRYRIVPMASGSTVGPWLNATAGSGSFTWPLGGVVDGEYAVHVCPVTAENVSLANPTCLYPLVRRVGVEKDAPTMTATLQGTNFSLASWIPRSFVLEGEVVTGFDNVTSAANVTLVATTPSGALATLRTELLTTNPASDRYAFRITGQVANAVAAETQITLRLTVVTETGRGVQVTRTLRLDPAAPAVVLAPLADGTPAQLRGWANDTLSGTSGLKLTLTRDDGTYWTGTAWATGTAVPLLPTLACTGGDCSWSLSIEGAVTLDSSGRLHTILLVATDVAGNSGGPPATARRFDTAAPTVGTVAAPGGTRVAGGTMTVDVPLDDPLSGVRLVTATIRRPGGDIEEVTLAMASGHVRSGVWRLSLAPAQLPYGGNYGVTIRATDGGENTVTIPQFQVAVADDAPPAIEVAEATPTPAEAWSGATLLVRIAERTGLSYVQVNVSRPGEASGWKDVPAKTVDAVSGAGTYQVSTLTLLPLTRGATYDVTFRTKDAAHPEVTRKISLSVSANDRPRIVFLGNVTESAVTWIRAEPTLAWNVLDDNPRAAAVWPEIVVDGAVRNLTSSLQVAAIPGGLRVTATVAPALPAGASVQVRLKVADTQGAVNASEVAARVDAAGPAVLVQSAGTVLREGVRYATAATVVNVTAVDAGSGLAFLESSLDNLTWVPGPRNLTLGDWTALAAGNHTLRVRARDFAGNPSEAVAVFHVDRAGPRIVALEVGRRVQVAVDDEGIGVANGTVRLHARNATGSEWRAVPMAINGTRWEARVPTIISGAYVFHVEALDLAGNAGALGTAASPRTGFTHNLPPTLLLPGLANGSTVRGTVGLLWIAEDPEGATTEVTITARSGTRSFEVAGPTNTTTAEWNTTALPDGEVILRVLATDGAATTLLERRLLVANAAELRLPPPAGASAGSPLRLVLTPPGNLTVANATGVVQRQLGGNWVPVAHATVRSEAGQLVLEYAPSVVGKYRILLEVQYDGVAGMESLVWGPVEVAAAKPPPPPEFSPLFLGVVVGVILLVGAAAVAAWRWRT